jgi:hypothetical protein
MKNPIFKKKTFSFSLCRSRTNAAAFCIVAADPQIDLVCSLAQPIVSGISIKFLEKT